MIFPTDQEYFKDIGSDGKLDRERFPKGETAVSEAFAKSAYENRKSSLRVDYTREKGVGDTGATQEELQMAVDAYETDVFIKAASDAYQQTKSGYIGRFPKGEVYAGKFSGDDLSETAEIAIKEQLEKYQPIDMKAIREQYEKAADCRKSLHDSRWAILFLLLHMAIVVNFLLPMVPGLHLDSFFPTEKNILAAVASCVILFIAWFLHVNTSNLWLVPGGIHMILTVFFLGWQKSEKVSGIVLLLAGAVIVVISVLSLGRYLADSFSRYYRDVVREFKAWCDQGCKEEHRRLRFAILWYRDITGKNKTPFDDMEREFEKICDKGKKL